MTEAAEFSPDHDLYALVIFIKREGLYTLERIKVKQSLYA